MNKLLDVPVIDLSPLRGGDAAARAALAREVDRACRDIGFLVIAGHGVDPALIERTRAVSRAFFALPLDEKRRVARPAPHVTRGYIGLHEESLARSRDPQAYGSDLNESLMIGPVDPPPPAVAESGRAHFAPNLWPERPAELRAVWSDYYRAMGALAADLMRLFALALDLPETFFDARIDHHISRLRVRLYPTPATPPEPGQIRAGAHSDYGSLTLLATEDKPGGLQVCNAEGRWRDVPIVPGTFIVNLGELMARWTNHRWVSTLHRVVNPPIGALASGIDTSRLSLVFFHNPNHDAVIECLDRSAPAIYPPTTSGEHLRRQFVATQNPAAAAAP
ncbi:MAG: isopenicillin N synthase family oxygenase [Burkholderiaceae bacterium]|nr:isopenicillin N synthase family oxygenase [Burkholderiaceae bacterium]